MTNQTRQRQLIKQLQEATTPITATQLAAQYGVTRQVIVSDIAILRAGGQDILATTRGYLLNQNVTQNSTRYYAKLAFKHTADEMEQEMRTIISYGGHIESLEVEHPVYGNITVNFTIRSLAELEEFLVQFRAQETEPLSSLTNGIHLHLLSCETKAHFDKMVLALEKLNFLLK